MFENGCYRFVIYVKKSLYRDNIEVSINVNNIIMLVAGVLEGATPPTTRGVQWTVPPGLARGPAHYIVVSCRAGPVTVVGRAGTTWVSGPCRA